MSFPVWTVSPNMDGDILGILPTFFWLTDPRPAAEQLAERYSHGGGFSPFGEGEWKFDKATGRLNYPGDPPYRPGAHAQLRHETLVFYPVGQFLLIWNRLDDTFKVTRVD